jgi:hypothetical protein
MDGDFLVFIALEDGWRLSTYKTSQSQNPTKTIRSKAYLSVAQENPGLVVALLDRT